MKTNSRQAGHRYLTDDRGHPSSMRLMSMLALITSIAFGLITVLKTGVNHDNGLYITVLFVLAAFAPKALQKFAESKFPQFQTTASKQSNGRAEVSS